MLGAAVTFAAGSSGRAATLPDEAYAFLENHCLDCHDSLERNGDLDLEQLSFDFDLGNANAFATWVLAFDRADHGEMPPKDKKRPSAAELDTFLNVMRDTLLQADRERIAQNGRAKVRRLNRFEYENTLKSVLDAPWLQVAHRLPEDGVDHLFNKIGERLDVSHVQMAKFLETAEYAIRHAVNAAAHPPETRKYYARDEAGMVRNIPYRTGQRAATRSAMPLLGTRSQVEVIRGEQPYTVGESDPEKREQEALGYFSGTYTATTKYDFNNVVIPTDGRYRLRIKTYTFRAGPNGRSAGSEHGLVDGNQAWHRPDRNVAMPGLRSEPVTLYALADSGDSRWLGTYDSLPEPLVAEMEVDLRQGEKIRPDAGRLVRTRPGWSGNPNADKNGVPGFALQWLEVEGPLAEHWPPASYQAVFGDAPFELSENGRVRVLTQNPEADARALLERFVAKTRIGKAVSRSQIKPYFNIYQTAIELGESHTDALILAFASSLCSPHFLYLESQAGPLSDVELAKRLSLFLWNGPPDPALLHAGDLRDPAVLHEQIERMLADPKSNRFLDQFLDYWLDLREINANTPDAELYPDYYLDDQLTEASLFETRRFFRELVDRDLPVRNLVDSEFTFVNERLAQHYGLPAKEGVALRRVEIPADSPRGGLLTQASVLRVTANGTTTSPVLRGAWIVERLLGVHIPQPPSGIAAVEPDTRGATTIREQLALHTDAQSCYACHAKFDPAGFALESFDIGGGWRDRYRAIGDIGEQVDGFGKNGHAYAFRKAIAVDASGTFDERPFQDIHDFKALLLSDPRAVARNLAKRLLVYATGADVSFADREELELVLDRSSDSSYGVRTLIHQVARSELFKIK